MTIGGKNGAFRADDDGKFDKVRKGEMFGRVYQAFFLSPAEVEYLEDNGAHIFEQEFWKPFKGKPSKDATPAEVASWAKQHDQMLGVRRTSCIAERTAPHPRPLSPGGERGEIS